MSSRSSLHWRVGLTIVTGRSWSRYKVPASVSTLTILSKTSDSPTVPVTRTRPSWSPTMTAPAMWASSAGAMRTTGRRRVGLVGALTQRHFGSLARAIASILRARQGCELPHTIA